jgi:hypothetical protein
MKRTLLISAALLTFACGQGSQQAQPAHDASTPAASAPAGSATGGATGTTPPGANEMVTLVGCLRGPALPGATGTAGGPAGDRARLRATGNDAASAGTHGSASTGRFTLLNVIVESGGSGANGAGASGGPVVSAQSAVELDGLPADAQASVNKQVRVTGRIDSRPAGSAAATGAASPSGGSTSTRDDVRANSTTVADGAASTRRLTVETVQVVEQSCPEK